jgi:hypothetical protein
MTTEFWSTLVAGGTAVIVMAFILACILWFWTAVVREVARTFLRGWMK